MTAITFPLYFSFGAGKPINQDIDDMVAAGATGVRFSLPWDGGDPGHTGAFTTPSSWDAIIQYCNSKTCLNGQDGFDVILQIAIGNTFGGVGSVGSPGSSPGMAFNHNANADGSPGNNGPINVPLLLSSFAVSVGTRYQPGSSHGEIRALEMLNEPNHAKADTGVWVINGTSIPCSGVADSQKGIAYFEYLARVYPPLHALNVTVITGGLGGTVDAPGDQPADQFLTNLYSAAFTVGSTTYHGTDGLWDHFNFHPYEYYNTPSEGLALPPNKGRGWQLMVESIVPILTAHGHLSKGIWVTEFGQPTPGGAGQDVQSAADALTDAAVTQWNTYSYGGAGGNPLCWFTFQDKDPDPKNRPYGVIDKFRNKKQPLWNTFHDLGSGTTTPPPPIPTLPVALGVTIPDFVSNPGAANLGARPGNTPFKRGVIYWSGFQAGNPGNKSAGQNDTVVWSQLDDMLDAAHANNYKLIGCIAYSPDWAKITQLGNDHTYPDRDTGNGYRDYANFCWLVADHCETRHPGTLIIEIWNEPQNGFLDPISKPNYVSMLSTAYDAVNTGTLSGRANRTAYPNVPIITGGTGAGPAVGSPNRHLNWCQYIITNAPSKFDHMTIHAYSGPSTPLGTNNGFDPGFNDIPGIRIALNAANRQDATIISTEAGVFISSQSGGGTLQQAADNLTGSYAWWLAHSQQYGLSVYCLYEQDDNGTDFFSIAGMYTRNSDFTGPAKTNGSGVPVFLNAFNQIQSASSTNNPPAVAIFYPTGTQTVKGTVVVAALALDDHDTPSQLTLSLRLQGSSTPLGTMSLQLGYGWYYTINTTNGSWPNGTYHLVVDAVDSDGALKTSAPLTIIVNNTGVTNTAPVLSWVTPIAGNTISGLFNFVVSATDDSDTTVGVEILDGPDPLTASVLGQALVMPSGQYQLSKFDTKTLADGAHVFIAQGTDSQNNIAFTDAITIQVRNSLGPPPVLVANCGSIGTGYIGEYAIGVLCIATVPDNGPSGGGGGGTTPPPVGGITFQTGPCVDGLWVDLPEFFRIADVSQDPAYPLLTYTRGIMQGLCSVMQLFDRIDYRSELEMGAPGDTSDLVNPDTADSNWLPWLAQLVGIDNIKTFPKVEDQRTAIKTASAGWQAGSTPGIISAVTSLLNGTKSVTVTRDYLNDPHQILVFTRESETPSGYATIQQAIENANVRPAGIKITVQVLLGTTYRVLDQTYSGKTYGTLDTDFSTYNELEDYQP